MALEPYLAEIFVCGFNFAPRGFALCNGQLLPISQNTALFSLIGTYYGGNGTSNFALPDLRGRTPNHQGQGPGLSPYVIGEVAGETTVTLISTEMAMHNHLVQTNNGDGDQSSPVNNFFAGPGADRDLYAYNAAASGGTPNVGVQAIGFTGSSLPHNNLMPYLVVNYVIAMSGIFPVRN